MREEGVEIVTGVEVRAIELGADGTASALETSRGRIEVGEQLVIAPGPWAKRFWSMLELPATIDVRTPSGEVVHDRPMWTYWNLQEGEIAVDPQMFATADGGAPPVIHLDTDAPLYTDDGELVTDELWGIYYKRDRHGVQGGASPLVVDGDVELDPYPSTTDVDPGFPDMWCAALSHAMSRFEGCRPLYKTARSGGVGAFTADNFPVFDYMRPNTYAILDSNHGYKMIGVGREVAKVLLGDHSSLLYPFRFERFATGDLPRSRTRRTPGRTTALALRAAWSYRAGRDSGVRPRRGRRMTSVGSSERGRGGAASQAFVVDWRSSVTTMASATTVASSASCSTPVGDEDADERRRDDARLAGPGDEDELLAAPAAAAVGEQRQASTVSGRAMKMSAASVISAGSASSAIGSKGRFAPEGDEDEDDDDVGARRGEQAHLVLAVGVHAEPERSMLATISPARNAPR